MRLEYRFRDAEAMLLAVHRHSAPAWQKNRENKGREYLLIDRKIRKEFLTVNMILLAVIGFQLSLLKGISVEKQLDVKRKELSECSGF